MTATATTATNDNGPKISQWHGHMEDYDSHKHWFLADRTNGRERSRLCCTVTSVCMASVCRLFVCRL